MPSQSEADFLIKMPKKRARNENYFFPYPGSSLVIPIVSTDEIETFLIDVNRGQIRLTKCSYQERYQGTFILVRLDVDGSPHPNPEVEAVPLSFLEPYNGVTLPTPHLHLYVEGFMDKWAIPAPSNKFPQTNDLFSTLEDFFRFCNVIEQPLIQRRLL